MESVYLGCRLQVKNTDRWFCSLLFLLPGCLMHFILGTWLPTEKANNTKESYIHTDWENEKVRFRELEGLRTFEKERFKDAIWSSLIAIRKNGVCIRENVAV